VPSFTHLSPQKVGAARVVAHSFPPLLLPTVPAASIKAGRIMFQETRRVLAFSAIDRRPRASGSALNADPSAMDHRWELRVGSVLQILGGLGDMRLAQQYHPHPRDAVQSQ
jgi:hypothetical protein